MNFWPAESCAKIPVPKTNAKVEKVKKNFIKKFIIFHYRKKFPPYLEKIHSENFRLAQREKILYAKNMSFNYLKKIFELLLQNRGALILLCALFLLAAALAFYLGRFFSHIEFESKLKKRISSERADAIKRSRSVLGGLAGEQIAPFLPGFPCNPADARFIGKPVDFVAFCGAAQEDKIHEIVFVEVKSGDATLSRREKEIRECVENGRVRFEVYNIPE